MRIWKCCLQNGGDFVSASMCWENKRELWKALLFVEHFFRLAPKRTSKLWILALCEENHWSLVDSLHIGPVMQNAYLGWFVVVCISRFHIHSGTRVWSSLCPSICLSHFSFASNNWYIVVFFIEFNFLVRVLYKISQVFWFVAEACCVWGNKTSCQRQYVDIWFGCLGKLASKA